MILQIDPVSKPRMTQRDRWAKRPSVVKYYDFCDDLRILWGENKVPEELYIQFNIPMPKSWSKKKRLNMDGKPHQQRPDIDNLVKAFLDALCEDDSYVFFINASKYWSEQGSIEALEY